MVSTLRSTGLVMTLAGVMVACGTGGPTTSSDVGSPLPIAEREAPRVETWDYVALGDSFTGFASWPRQLSSSIEQKLGVEVSLHDQTLSGQDAAVALERIRTDPRLRELIREAELITTNILAGSLESPLRTYEAGGDCGGSDNQNCLRKAFADIEADWRMFLEELVALPDADDVTIVTFKVGAWLAEHVCGWGNECWEVELGYLLDLNDFVERTALEHGLEVVDVNRAFHGPRYRMRIDDRYLLADGIHLSEEGSTVVADLLREVI